MTAMFDLDRAGHALYDAAGRSFDAVTRSWTFVRSAEHVAPGETLDAIGDLALAGARFIGCYRSYRGGHKLNAQALRSLLSDSSAYEIVEPAPREKRGMMPEFVAVNAPAFAPWMI